MPPCFVHPALCTLLCAPCCKDPRSCKRCTAMLRSEPLVLLLLRVLLLLPESSPPSSVRNAMTLSRHEVVVGFVAVTCLQTLHVQHYSKSLFTCHHRNSVNLSPCTAEATLCKSQALALRAAWKAELRSDTVVNIQNDFVQALKLSMAPHVSKGNLKDATQLSGRCASCVVLSGDIRFVSLMHAPMVSCG
jgi:hypothetical protein